MAQKHLYTFMENAAICKKGKLQTSHMLLPSLAGWEDRLHLSQVDMRVVFEPQFAFLYLVKTAKH